MTVDTANTDIDAKRRRAAEARLRAAAKKRDAGVAAVKEVVVETADVVSRRRAGELIGRTSARVQQIIDAKE